MSATRIRIEIALLLLASTALWGGCARISLPAVDPSGERLFLPCPQSTTLTIPCLDDLKNGEGCFGGCLPKPAFVDPPPPPLCLQQGGVQPQAAEPVCVDDCCQGPKAVFYDGNRCLKNFLHLPDRGKRGKILLNHRKIIAPVGGEVLLLSGICGCDGYLQTGQPIEWMLTPDSVGHFIEVGDDKENGLHRLVARNKVEKLSGSFARGRTSTKASFITRGNLRRDDDVQLREGETWLTVSSPSEGVSRVTVMAPESDCWDQRKATATIYWVDANWQFPQMVTRRAGEQVQLTTRVMRKEGGLPATGWKVLYEVQDPTLAQFQGEGGQAVSKLETTVKENGEATALLRPTRPEAGTTVVRVSIIRPAGSDEALPQITLGSGQTFVTWSAPRLEISAGRGAPVVASNEAFPVLINVRNSGDLTAEGVKVSAQLPPGVQLASTSLVQLDGSRVPAQHRIVGDNIIWDIGRMPAQQQLDIEMQLTAKASFDMSLSVRGSDGARELFAEDRVAVNVVQRNLSVRIVPTQQQVQVGQQATFRISVTNNGTTPITGVQMEVQGDDGLITFAGDTRSWQHNLYNEMLEPLQPGTSWDKDVEFQVRQEGQRCASVRVTGNPAQQADATSCIVGVPAPPANPAVAARIVPSPTQSRVGNLVLFKYFVRNSGGVPLTNVRVVTSFDESLQPRRFTNGYDDSQLRLFKAAWIIPRIEPGEERLVEGEFIAARPGIARVDLAIGCDQNVTANADASVPIEQIGSTPAPSPAPAPTIPNNTPAPIPGSQTPPLTPPPTQPSTPPPAAAGKLTLSLNTNDNPVAVNENVTFNMTVKNDRNVPDAQVVTEILVPAGTRLIRVLQTYYNGNVVENISADGTVIRLQPIASMRAGEEVSYTLVLASTVPQILTVEASSTSQMTRREQAAPATDSDRTEVIPR